MQNLLRFVRWGIWQTHSNSYFSKREKPDEKSQNFQGKLTTETDRRSKIKIASKPRDSTVITKAYEEAKNSTSAAADQRSTFANITAMCTKLLLAVNIGVHGKPRFVDVVSRVSTVGQGSTSIYPLLVQAVTENRFCCASLRLRRKIAYFFSVKMRNCVRYVRLCVLIQLNTYISQYIMTESLIDVVLST